MRLVSPIMVQGAAFADPPMISGFDTDVTRGAPDGAMVEGDPQTDPPYLRAI